MKKVMIALVSALCIFVLAGCAEQAVSNVEIDYGDSSVFSLQDRKDAVAVIRQEFGTWEGCELHSVTYAGDEANSAENVAWMNELQEGMEGQETFTQCIQFRSDFHSPKKSDGAWAEDEEYTDWQWWLARSEGGEWKLMTWGY